ncbi:ATP-binding cassette domain-containing protein [Aeromonas caviae]
MTAIHIKGLQADDGQKTLLQALDFTIHPGTALTLIGESGSGKSLLAHALMGTLPAPLTGRGEMVSGGRHHNLADTPRLRTLWGRELAMLPQEPVLALDPTMGLLAQVEEGWLPGGKEARSRARAALERLGLAGREGAFVHQLSGGWPSVRPLPPPPWGRPVCWWPTSPPRGSTAGPQPGWVPCCWATWPVDAIC